MANKKTKLHDVATNRKSTGSHVDKGRVFFDSNKIAKKSGDIEISANTPMIKQPKPPTINTEGALKVEKEIKEYNKKIYELDELYTSLKPIRKFLVRCFHMETTRGITGAIIEPSIELDAPTRSGQGVAQRIKSKYLYDKKAIIVASPENHHLTREGTKLQPGTVVILENYPLQRVVSAMNPVVEVIDGFVHPDSPHTEPPIFRTDRHYGYLLIDGSSFAAEM